MLDPASAPTPGRIQAQWVAQGGVVTYVGGTERAFSVSGTVGANVFYERYLCGTGSCAAMRWFYPTSRKPLVDPAVTAAVKSFTAGDLTTPH